jgi:ATP-dependent Clp protease ATP-binding subunit ClpA
MFERFATEARHAVEAAEQEARTSGRSSIEAEHLLLALSLRSEMQALGLDHDEIAEALAAEEEESLAAVGVELASFDVPASSRRTGNVKLGASAKLAIQHGLIVTTKRGQRRITAANLLLGLLDAEHGRVPRALRFAGIDADELRARL